MRANTAAKRMTPPTAAHVIAATGTVLDARAAALGWLEGGEDGAGAGLGAKVGRPLRLAAVSFESGIRSARGCRARDTHAF